MYSQQQWITQRRRFRPRIVLLGKTVGIVGEGGSTSEDERAFAAKRIV
jgi:hypothetical protein